MSTPDRAQRHEYDTTEIIQNTENAANIDREAGIEPGLARLVWVEPGQLVIGLNTRTEVRLDPHFCRDVAARGVREPITARRGADGRLVVRKGQRRTLAAVKAALGRVPVLIEADSDADEDDMIGQVDRIVDQWGENFHRAPISEGDEARAHQQLLDLGLSAAQIARRTHIPAKRVRALHAVTTSPMARAALGGVGGPALRLDQAAIIAEFDDGGEDSGQAVERLLEVAESDPDRFGHVVQRLRDDRQEKRLVAEHAQALAEQGVRVLTDADAEDAVELCRLRPGADSPSGTPLSEEEHSSCPGHAVHLTVRWDWQAQAKTVHSESHCTQPQRHATRIEPGGNLAGNQGGERGDDDDQVKERQRTERRRVIANNRAWESATAHRRQWLTEFLSRKKAPADAAVFIATTLAVGSHDARRAMEGGQASACALLKLPELKPGWAGRSSELAEAAGTASAARATQIALAVLLGAYEDGTSRDSWRVICR